MLGDSNTTAERLPVNTEADLDGIEYDALDPYGGGYALQFPENEAVLNDGPRFPWLSDESEIRPKRTFRASRNAIVRVFPYGRCFLKKRK